MRRVRVVVVGRVQGVGFRWFVRQEARRLGVAGWVRNRADGAVELETAGEDTAVERLLQHVRVGPEAADVTDVLISDAQLAGSVPYPFSILK
ncbi:MAG: acylphosphatase [Gemmatimonadaceae bacterium]